ncbi:MAG: hypothetical protein EU549_04490 [Promethearchaeota archaeon]|nr:MAG: hypothetical protein EU549_04490 [Candidatus Lokiarchaeota archaeon]
MSKENNVNSNPMILFGVYLDSLLNLSLFKRDEHYQYPLNTLFREVVEDIRNYWMDNPFLEICNCDCIITLDVLLFEEINENNQLINEIHEINDSFKFWFNDLSDDLKSLNPINIEK